MSRRPNTRASQDAPTSQRSTTRASQAASTSRASQAASTPRASQAASASRNNISMDPYELPEGTQTGGGRKLPIEEENNLIGSVIRYMLVADRSKNMIQRLNIIKAAMPNHSKHFKYIMSKVLVTLRQVFGYNLLELEGSKYMLTNNLENNERHLNFSEREKSEQVLLFIALAHIFMSDESGCSQDDLFNLFRALDIIEEDDFQNEYFGNVKYLLTDKFIKQGYLALVIVDNSDIPIKHYQWGVRAENEITLRHVLEFMSKIFDGRPLNTWPRQFKMMQARENLEEMS